ISKFARAGLWVDAAWARSIARNLIDRLAIKTRNENSPIASLSGGNAQKVMLARQLVEVPSVLVLEEPSQGVDVRAKEEIHTIIGELSDQGIAVLVVTSDL